MALDSQSENIFKLEDPSNYYCKLMGYTPSHSEMFIAGQNIRDNQVLYFAFSDVHHFCGPLGWKGANFELSHDEKCLELARLDPTFETLTDSDIIKEFKLYLVRNERFEVTILASNWPGVSKTSPGRFVFGP